MTRIELQRTFVGEDGEPVVKNTQVPWTKDVDVGDKVTHEHKRWEVVTVYYERRSK